MINLLPPEQIKELKDEENLKLVLNLGILFLLFLISLFLILFSIKIYLFGNLEIQNMILKEREKALNLELEKEIKNFNNLLLKIDSFYQEKIDLVSVLEKISKTLPEGIYLTNLNLSISKKEINVSLSGFSPDQKNLISFRKNLEKDFSEVDFPLQNWLKLTNIDFSVSFKIK